MLQVCHPRWIIVLVRGRVMPYDDACWIWNEVRVPWISLIGPQMGLELRGTLQKVKYPLPFRAKHYSRLIIPKHGLWAVNENLLIYDLLGKAVNIWRKGQWLVRGRGMQRDVVSWNMNEVKGIALLPAPHLEPKMGQEVEVGSGILEEGK